MSLRLAPAELSEGMRNPFAAAEEKEADKMRSKIMTIVIIILCLFILVGLGLSVYTWNLYRNGNFKNDPKSESLQNADADTERNVLAAVEYTTAL